MSLFVQTLVRSAACALATVAIAASAQTVSPQDPNARPPAFPAASTARPAPAAPDMQAVLTALGRLGARPVQLLTPAQARSQPSPADAVKRVMKAKGLSTEPDPAVTTRELPYGSNALQKVRIYTPQGAAGALRPMVVYFHGGGWVIADLDVYDATPRMLAKQLDAVVVSVEYRRAPEFKFPAQHEDAEAAYRWVMKNGKDLGGDVSRIALAGESAGGNLAINVGIAVRDARLPAPRHILAVYPIADSRVTLPAKIANANAKPLNTPMLSWFGYYFSSAPGDVKDPRIDLVGAKLAGLPPVTIVNAQIDPLLSDGENLAKALRAAEVPVQQRTFARVTHEFFGMGQVVAGAREANAYAVGRLKADLVIR